LNTLIYTALALLAFAGNSILCRLALANGEIDAASFTSIRLLSGIVVLALILKLSAKPGKVAASGSWKASFMLFVYAVSFSYAYLSLDTGMGALILFACVQITMILMGVLSGNTLRRTEGLGVVTAFSGFVYLVLPGVSAPSLTGFLLMALAGIAWAFYTLAGKTSSQPLADTASNFLRTLPLLLLLFAVSVQYASLSLAGVLMAVLSGGLASGVGYTIWYAALGGLSTVQAAVVQLLVPVLAAIGGVLFADEIFSARLLIASCVILGGILIVILGRYYSER
jgi:drug/metabolite transporter (DMT)-like permease